MSSYVEFFLVLGVNVRDAIASKMQEFGTNETFITLFLLLLFLFLASQDAQEVMLVSE